METGIMLKIKILYGVIVLIVIGWLCYLVYQNYILTQAKNALEIELANTKQDFSVKSEELRVNIDALSQLLKTAQDDKTNAEQDIYEQQELLNNMNAQASEMAGVLDVYKKLATTDRELLAKYSKIYFLNENYTPVHSTSLLSSYTYGSSTEKMISTDVWPFLQKLLDDANTNRIDIKVISAFRSFDTQGTLKSAYRVTYGSGSNRFSADQGYSEHQLGTTLDFTTSKLGANFYAFEKTTSYVWLTENAYKYGFILSYPKGNAYYIFEPWHWRFVGKALALKLHNDNKNFYDMPQREINEYLVSIFDQQ